MVRVAFYGKGGIGKSTIASNMAISCAQKGMKVLLIGCDPKADSTRNIMGRRIPTVIDVAGENSDSLTLEDIIFKGRYGISCIEAGGPESGCGCAGLGITLMQNELETLGVFNKNWDIIIYDILGDVVCGGFAVPVRKKFVDKVIVISSSELMSVYAANNILKCVRSASTSEFPMLGGIVLNKVLDENDIKIINVFANKTNSKVLGEIEYSSKMRDLGYKICHQIIEDASIGEKVNAISSLILSNTECTVPTPLTNNEFDLFVGEINSMLGC
ncbi:ArsA-related P-loop ATPase [Eubacteriales bacterium KG127]